MSARPALARTRVTVSRRRALATALLLTGALLLVTAPSSSAQQGGAVIDIADAEGILDGTVASFLADVLEQAAERGSEMVVLQLDVRGAIGGSAARLAEAIASSDVPVVTWVGPPGAHASGGGLLLAQAGHVRAAAPGTLLGPAAPVDLAAASEDARAPYEELAEAPASALEQPLGGGAVAIAPAGGDQALPPDAALPPGLTLGDVTVMDETAAVEAGLLDLTAASLADLLPALDGREVTLGATTTTLEVDPATVRPRFNNLGLVRQLLHAVAQPTLAYLLLVGGALALAFEVFQPGFGVAGISGIVTAALGVYGFVVLPGRWLALAAVLVGLALLAADLAIGRLGLLTLSGLGVFVAGSWWLLPGPEPLLMPWWLVVLTAVTVAVFFVGVLTTVLRAQGNQALSGAERVVGEVGVVRSMLNPEGHVFVGGALWRARAPEDAGRVSTGTRVRVIGLDDSLTLEVVPLSDGEAAAEPSSRSSVG